MDEAIITVVTVCGRVLVVAILVVATLAAVAWVVDFAIRKTWQFEMLVRTAYHCGLRTYMKPPYMPQAKKIDGVWTDPPG